MYRNNRNNNRPPGNTNSGYGRGQYGARGQGNRYGSQIPGQSYKIPSLLAGSHLPETGYGSQMQSQSYNDSHQNIFTNTNLTHIPGSRYGGQQPSSSYKNQQQLWQGESDMQRKYGSNMPNQSYSGQDQGYSHMPVTNFGRGAPSGSYESGTRQDQWQTQQIRFEDYGQRNSGPASLTRGMGGGMGRKRKTQSQCCDDAAKKKRLADTSSDHLDREVAGVKREAVSTFRSLIVGCAMPLIGLEYISEYVTSYKANSRFLCYVCEAQVDGPAVVTHLTGKKHMINCLSLSDEVSYNSQNENPPMDELGKAARELERRTGRQQITVVYDKKSASNSRSRPSGLGNQAKNKYSRRGTDVTQTTNIPGETTCLFNEMIKDDDSAMLGLSYITELQSIGHNTVPNYMCRLCECRCNVGYIVPHITGLQHRTKFMEISHKKEFQQVSAVTDRDEKRALVSHHAILIEMDLGREKVCVKMIGKPSAGPSTLPTVDPERSEVVAGMGMEHGYVEVPAVSEEIPQRKKKKKNLTKKQRLRLISETTEEIPQRMKKKKKLTKKRRLKLISETTEKIPQRKKKKKKLTKKQRPKLIAKTTEEKPAIEIGKINLEVEDLALLRKIEMEIFSQSPNLKHNLYWRAECPYLCGQCGYRDVTCNGIAEHQVKRKHRKARAFHNDQLFSLRTSVFVVKAEFVCSLCGFKRKGRETIQLHIENKHQNDVAAVILVDGFLCTDNYEKANSKKIRGQITGEVTGEEIVSEQNDLDEGVDDLDDDAQERSVEQDWEDGGQADSNRSKLVYKKGHKRRNKGQQVEERPTVFVCAFCGFQSENNSDVENHQKNSRHSNAKTVTWNETMKEMSQVRLEEAKKYSCSICLFSSNFKDMVNYHIKHAAAFRKRHLQQAVVTENNIVPGVCEKPRVDKELSETSNIKFTENTSEHNSHPVEEKINMPAHDIELKLDQNSSVKERLSDDEEYERAFTEVQDADTQVEIAMTDTVVKYSDEIRETAQPDPVQTTRKPDYWMCTSCGHICPDSPTSLRWRHYALMHNDTAPYTCSLCCLRSTDEATMLDHLSICGDGATIVSHTGIFPLTFGPQADFLQLSWKDMSETRCLVCCCGFTAMSASEMDAHTSLAGSDHTWVSKRLTFDEFHKAVCDWNTATTAAAHALSAVKIYRPMQWRCNSCNTVKRAVFNSRIDPAPLQLWPIRHHLLHHSDEGPFYCALCGFRALTQERVQRHIGEQNHGSEYEIIPGEATMYPCFNNYDPDITLEFCDEVEPTATSPPPQGHSGRGGDTLDLEYIEAPEDSTMGDVTPGIHEEDINSIGYVIELNNESYGGPPPGYLWKCTSCGMCTPDKKRTLIHFQLYHSPHPQFRCADCNFPSHSLSYLDFHLQATGHSWDDTPVRKVHVYPLYPLFFGDHRHFELVKAVDADMIGRGVQHTHCTPGSSAGYTQPIRRVQWFCKVCDVKLKGFKLITNQIRKMVQEPFIHHEYHINRKGMTCAHCGVHGKAKVQMKRHAERENHRLVAAKPVFDGPNPDFELCVWTVDNDSEIVEDEAKSMEGKVKLMEDEAKLKENVAKSMDDDLKSEESDAQDMADEIDMEDKATSSEGKETPARRDLNQSQENVDHSVTGNILAALYSQTRQHDYLVIPGESLCFINGGGLPLGYVWKCTSCGIVLSLDDTVVHFRQYHMEHGSTSEFRVKTESDNSPEDAAVSGEDTVSTQTTEFPLFFGPQADFVPIVNDGSVTLGVQDWYCAPREVIKTYLPMYWNCELCGQKANVTIPTCMSTADPTCGLQDWPLEHYVMTHSRQAPVMCPHGCKMIDETALIDYCELTITPANIKRGVPTLPNLVGAYPDLLLCVAQHREEFPTLTPLEQHQQQIAEIRASNKLKGEIG